MSPPVNSGQTGPLLEAAAQALTVQIQHVLRPGGQKLIAVGQSSSGLVVVKVVRLAGAGAPMIRERAHREFEILHQIQHPNLVALRSDLVEIAIPEPALAWAEEHLPGDDLEQLMGGQWTWDRTERVGIDISAALAALHGAGIVHRDLSPKNVRVLSDGTVKLIDPGIARVVALTTITGPMDPGTPGYMSPEHVSFGVRPTFASDVFVAGILMYRLVADLLPIPFTGDMPDYVRRLRQTQSQSIATRFGCWIW